MYINTRSLSEVSFDIGIPEEDILDLMAEGGFPMPISNGKGTVCWIESEVYEWLDD